jgi:hypothetical protein
VPWSIWPTPRAAVSPSQHRPPRPRPSSLHVSRACRSAHPFKRYPFKRYPFKRYPFKRYPFKRYLFKRHPFKRYLFKRHPVSPSGLPGRLALRLILTSAQRPADP